MVHDSYYNDFAIVLVIRFKKMLSIFESWLSAERKIDIFYNYWKMDKHYKF